MGNNDKKLITVSEETQIDRPANREMFPVEKTDWERVKRLIKNINISANRWENAGWFTVPIVIAFFIATLTLPADKDKYKMYFFIAAISCFIIALLLFFVSRIFSKTSRSSKNEVLDEMKQMEDKTIKKEQNGLIKLDQLKILFALYGTEKKNIDIAGKLNALISDNKLNIRVSNDIDGDPSPGVFKKLKIRYRFQGNEIEKDYKEGDLINLP